MKDVILRLQELDGYPESASMMGDLMASRILVEISEDEISNCEEGVF